MRKITLPQTLAFVAQWLVALALAIATTGLVFGGLPLGDFRGVVLVAVGVLLLYGYEIVFYRLLLAVFPLREGEIAHDSQQEFVYHVYLLFYLLLFYSVTRSGFFPVPVLRLFYLALGTRLGANTYSAGILYDPPFIRMGSNSVVGQGALLIPHVIEGDRLAHYPITVGDNVTIGAGSIVLSNVRIGNGAIVAAGAVVPKGSRIGAGEAWAGVPAKCVSASAAAKAGPRAAASAD